MFELCKIFALVEFVGKLSALHHPLFLPMGTSFYASKQTNKRWENTCLANPAVSQSAPSSMNYLPIQTLTFCNWEHFFPPPTVLPVFFFGTPRNNGSFKKKQQPTANGTCEGKAKVSSALKGIENKGKSLVKGTGSYFTNQKRVFQQKKEKL